MLSLDVSELSANALTSSKIRNLRAPVSATFHRLTQADPRWPARIFTAKSLGLEWDLFPDALGLLVTSSLSPVLLLVLPAEADFAAAPWVGRRRHELTDGLDQPPDRVVMSAYSPLQLGKLPGWLLVRGQELAELDKSAHHVDADLDGPGAVEDFSRHDGAVLGLASGEDIHRQIDVLPGCVIRGTRGL